MRVLCLMPYSPLPLNFGGAIRVYHILKALALSHEVTIVTLGTERDRATLLEHFGSYVRDIHVIPFPQINRYKRFAQCYTLWSSRSFFFLCTRSNKMQATIDRILHNGNFDAVHCEFPMMGAYDVEGQVMKVLDAHNVEYDNFRRMAHLGPSLVRRLHYKRECLKVKREELTVCRKQNAILTTSNRDKALLDVDAPDVPKYVIPNGVDTSYFVPSTEPSEEHSLVFSGMMGYVPNYDGALYFLDEIFPKILRRIPNARIYIVGNKPPRLLLKRRSANIIVTGYVNDVRPYLQRGSVYVVPLRMGSGTRLKVLEAMAMRTPIVTTSIGCEGIDVNNGESVAIADEPEVFAERVIELFSNATLRKRLIDAGSGLVHSMYNWTTIGQRVADVYESLSRQRTVKHAPRLGDAAHIGQTTRHAIVANRRRSGIASTYQSADVPPHRAQPG